MLAPWTVNVPPGLNWTPLAALVPLFRVAVRTLVEEPASLTQTVLPAPGEHDVRAGGVSVRAEVDRPDVREVAGKRKHVAGLVPGGRRPEGPGHGGVATKGQRPGGRLLELEECRQG